MNEEESQQLKKENIELKEALVGKDQRIEELEGLLLKNRNYSAGLVLPSHPALVCAILLFERLEGDAR